MIPYEYAADSRATLAVLLGAGAGLVLSGILSMATYRSVIAAWMLAGLILIPFGISVVSGACYYGVVAVPIGAEPGPSCDPGLSMLGISLSALGAGTFGFGVIRLRGSRTG